MKILPNGAWPQETADATHQSSPNLAKFMFNHLSKAEITIDFGCGNGYYLGYLSALGFKYLIGVEGFPLNNFLFDNIEVRDLSKPQQLGIKGNVISLEVGEHIPKTGQEAYMHTVTSHVAPGCMLVFSWAEIGQPGLGHINCRDQKEVIADVQSRGFKYLEDLTIQTRATIEENTSWFQRTLLIFEKT